jgi:hypothetical protein
VVNEWQPLDPSAAAQLSDARRQLHHAAQLATAFGISYLEKQADDSHTNLEWLESEGALASHSMNDTRVAICVHDLAVMTGGRTFGLRGKTMDDGAEWLRERLAEAGFDPAKFTLKRHYEIPRHPVASGAKFDAAPSDLQQLADWYSNAAAALEEVRISHGGTEVRCWPHHFDIATLITVAPGKTVGVGMEPGDKYYDEPYFYINMNPSPSAIQLPDTLDGEGQWHADEWTGAVLPASKFTGDALLQTQQLDDFLHSAVDAAIRLVRSRQA